MNLSPFTTEVDGLTLRGTLYVPEGVEGPAPTAVLFHGFGGNRVDFSGILVQVARALSQHGIAVATYDRAGHGESDGDFFDTSVSRDIRHAHAVLATVAAREEVDADAGLHLAGLSLGAVITSAVAAEALPRIASVSLWSNAAVFVDEIKGGTIQGRPLTSLAEDGYFDFLGVRMGPAMVEDAVTYDVYARAAGYGGPALVMHGTQDFVPVSYAERFAQLWDGRTELHVVEGADHGWGTVPHRDMVVAETMRFITSHAGGGVA